MYLICDWNIGFSINSWDIRKQLERQTSQKRSVKANRDEKKGKGKKRSCKKLDNILVLTLNDPIQQYFWKVRN